MAKFRDRNIFLEVPNEFILRLVFELRDPQIWKMASLTFDQLKFLCWKTKRNRSVYVRIILCCAKTLIAWQQFGSWKTFTVTVSLAAAWDYTTFSQRRSRKCVLFNWPSLQELPVNDVIAQSHLKELHCCSQRPPFSHTWRWHSALGSVNTDAYMYMIYVYRIDSALYGAISASFISTFVQSWGGGVAAWICHLSSGRVLKVHKIGQRRPDLEESAYNVTAI